MTGSCVAFVPPAQHPMTFSAVPPVHRAGQGLDPGSNTGPKYQAPIAANSLTEPLVDFLTVVVPAGALKKTRCRDYREMLAWIFGTGSKVVMTSIEDKPWQFHEQSATLIDETNSVCGKVGFSETGKICFSLSGKATRHLDHSRASMARLVHKLKTVEAHITRIDIAVDDLQGRAFNVEQMRQAYKDGAFTSNGRPPKSRHFSDEGSGDGCTLYIGQKGHKELCIYEKGKQLGDVTSSYTRCELRLYGSKVELPLDVLTSLGEHFAGSYPLLAEFIVGEATKLQAKEVMVNASAVAMVRVLRQQAGTALRLCMDAFKDDAVEFLLEHVARPGVPGRFKGFTGDLPQQLHDELTRENENGQGTDPRCS